MRKSLVILFSAVLAGCASPPIQHPANNADLMGTPPKTLTMAPHTQARKFRQEKERQTAFDDGLKIEGATVVK